MVAAEKGSQGNVASIITWDASNDVRGDKAKMFKVEDEEKKHEYLFYYPIAIPQRYPYLQITFSISFIDIEMI